MGRVGNLARALSLEALALGLAAAAGALTLHLDGRLAAAVAAVACAALLQPFP